MSTPQSQFESVCAHSALPVQDGTWSAPKDQNAPRVSIIVLNWNQFEVTAACLSTLSHLAGPTYEVLVVDQASDHNEGERLKADYPWIQLIASPTNVGFTGGNNLAMHQARGEFVLLLNNDTEVPSDFLEPLVAHFDAHPHSGVASPKIRYFDAPDTIQYAGSDGISEWTMRGSKTGFMEKDTGQYDAPREVALAHGAAMMIRRKVIEDIGLLASDFFIYYEELDFCARAARAGWSIHYVPDSLVLHKESVSMGKASPLKTEFMTRNRINYLRRNLSGLKRVFALLFVLLISTPLHLARHLMSGRRAHAKSLIRGLWWHAKPRRVHKNERLAAGEDSVRQAGASSTTPAPGAQSPSQKPEAIANPTTDKNSRRAAA